MNEQRRQEAEDTARRVREQLEREGRHNLAAPGAPLHADPMRVLGWILIVFGLLLIPTYWNYATRETARLDKVWWDSAMTSGSLPTLERAGQMLREGMRPTWTIVSPWPGVLAGVGLTAFGVLLLAIRRPEKVAAAAVLLLLLTGCGLTLPGHQAGPGPRSTQYTYPGRAYNPDTGLAHSPIPAPAEPEDGGVFVYGLVFHDGSTAQSIERFTTLAICEQDRATYAGYVKAAGAAVMTVRCYRAHETGAGATQTR